MKGSAIIRICLWTILAAVLTVIMIVGMAFGSLKTGNWNVSLGGYHYGEEGSYSVGETALETDAVHSIDIDWLSGNIRIVATEENRITVNESETASSDDALRWRLHDGELQIKYCKPRRFGKITFAKDLEICVPSSMLTEDIDRTLYGIEVENVSSQIHVEGLAVRSLDIESVSGNIDLLKSEIGTLEIGNVSGTVQIEKSMIERAELSTVSGNVSLNGTVRSLELKGVSARLDVYTLQCPAELSCESVSGYVKLVIPEQSGFRVQMDSVSGKLSATDFGILSRGNGTYVCGDGSADFEIETVSGMVEICKITAAE